MKKVILQNSCASCGSKHCAKKVSLFSSLSQEQLSKITAMIKRGFYKKGDPLFLEGEVSDKLYIINQGSLKVYTFSKEGKEQILYILREGDFLGDLSLIKKGIFNFNASALQDTHICMITKEDFDSILKDNPEITFKIMEHMHDRILNLENLIQTLTTKDVDSRVASLLLEFSKQFGVETKEGIEVITNLSREDMANYIGVTRETISRKLSAFEQENIIEILGNKKILIKDLDYLRELV